MRDEQGRWICTATEPWKPEHGDRAIHPDAEEVGDRDRGDAAAYKCPNCGKRFEVELPQ